MMSIDAALSAATTLVGHVLPAGPAGERARPARTTSAAEDAPETPTGDETATGDGALLVAIEAGLREAGYLAH